MISFMIVATSCGNWDSKKSDKADSRYKAKILKVPNNKLDDYPVTDSMFYNDGAIEEGGVYSYSNWFTNDSIKQTLVFELYTDKHRIYTYHFMNNNFPNYLIKNLPFQFSENQTFNQEKLQYTFPKFIERSKRISQFYFTTKKGLILGQLKHNVLINYGTPNSKEIIHNIEKYTWGEKLNRIEMYFDKNRLIAIFIYRDLL